jgi:hypothetical protein
MADDDFWNDISYGVSSMDDVLGGKLPKVASLEELTDRGRDKHGLKTPADVGIRVRFAYNLGSVLNYKHVPEEGVEGTVIMVRNADGDATGEGDFVYVKWDDGSFLRTHRHHLRAASAMRTASSPFQMRASNLGDLTSFFLYAEDKNADLIHKSTKDLWKFEEKDGEYVISRLFDPEGEPLKA